MTGGTVVLVPIRSFSGGKTRLAGTLSGTQRAALTKQMLAGVVEATAGSGVVDSVVVISPDSEVLHFAVNRHPWVIALLQRPDRPGLNAAIEHGREWATENSAAIFMVLFGDLPLLDATDVQHFVRRDAPVVIAPDRHGTGTNALLLRHVVDQADQPPFRFGFGSGSHVHHVDEAHRLGLDVAVSLTPGTAMDLDTPDDLATIYGRTSSWGGLKHAIPDVKVGADGRPRLPVSSSTRFGPSGESR